MPELIRSNRPGKKLLHGKRVKPLNLIIFSLSDEKNFGSAIFSLDAIAHLAYIANPFVIGRTK
jgi:hypothetical protein